MKKLKITFVFLSLALPGLFAYDFVDNGLKYVIFGSEVGVSGDPSQPYIFFNAVTVPSSVTYNETEYPVTFIDKRAFMSARLPGITLPNTIQHIGAQAFQHCTDLTSVNLPSGLVSIDTAAFCNTGLTSIVIPASVTYIAPQAFSDCPSFASIVVNSGNPIYDSRDNCNAIIETSSNTLINGSISSSIPASVTSIADYAFYFIPVSTSVTFHEGLTSIGKAAFASANLYSLIIPASLTSIGQSAFVHNENIVAVYVDPANPVYDSRDNCNALIKTADNELIIAAKISHIPEGIETIDSYAFRSYALDSIYIPASVTSVSDYSLYNSVRSIRCDAVTPPTASSFAFYRPYYGADYPINLYVPKESVEAYKTASVWNKFSHIYAPVAVSVNSNDSTLGIGFGTAAAFVDDSVSIYAVCTSNSVFNGWSDGVMDNPRLVVPVSDTAFTAIFAQRSLDTVYITLTDTITEFVHDTVYEQIIDTVYEQVTDTVYLEYDGGSAMEYSLADLNVYYFMGRVVNTDNIYIKLYDATGKLLAKGSEDIDMSNFPSAVYIVTDGKGGFLKIVHENSY